MSWRIVFVTDNGEPLYFNRNYGDLGDAAGDLNGGDAIRDLVDKMGKVTIKEIRLIPKQPEVFGSD